MKPERTAKLPNLDPKRTVTNDPEFGLYASNVQSDRRRGALPVVRNKKPALLETFPVGVSLKL